MTVRSHAKQTRDGEITTAVNARAVEDSEREVLNGASEALARIAERENAQAIAGVTARLENHNWTVRIVLSGARSCCRWVKYPGSNSLLATD